ncbi:hypothetical protein EAN04_24600 [Salmonella enterica]|nr:hypothetical protein [Salmonella enterica]
MSQHNHVSGKMETITPETATELLKHNIGNRKISQSVVSKYVQAILAGRWEENGETIKISLDGRLLDGQHRLKAVVQSMRAIRTFVVRGLKNGCQPTIDTGRGRGPADTITFMQNKTSNTTVASAIKMLIHYENAKNWLNPTGFCTYPVDNRAIGEYSLAHQEELEKNVKYLKDALTKRSGMTYLTGPERLFFYTIFSRVDPELANQFVEIILKGVGVPGQGTWAILRDYLDRVKLKKVKYPPARVRHTIIKGWNALRAGKEINSLNGIHPSDSDPIIAK